MTLIHPTSTETSHRDPAARRRSGRRRRPAPPAEAGEPARSHCCAAPAGPPSAAPSWWRSGPSWPAAHPTCPSRREAFTALRTLLRYPFYDLGPNDKGIGIQLGVSLVKVFSGFAMAVVIGIPLGLLIGASRRAWAAANPVVQILRPVSPLAWFPIWLVVLKDVGKAAIFVIFITALWPTVHQHRRRRRRRSPSTSATWPGCSGSAGWPTCATS